MTGQDKRHLIEGLEGVAYQSADSSLFEVDDWAIYDWAMTLKSYPHLETLVQAATKVGIDAREGFFALAGYDLKDPNDPRSLAWQSVLDSSAWRKARAQAKGQYEKASLLTSLLQKMGRRALDALEDQEPQELLDDLSLEDQEPQELLDDLSLEDLLEVEELEGVPTEEEIEDGETFLVLAKMVADWHGENEDSLQETMELAQTIDMQALKDLFGFTARVVKGASRKAKGTRGEMVGFKASNWSDKVIIQDMLGVASGDLQTMVKLAESGLMSRDYESQEPQGKGSVILLRDETGSMASGYQNPGHHRPAQALEVSLAHAFNKDGRDLITIAWGGDRNGGSPTRKHTWGEGDALEHLKAFLNTGYTYLYNALRQALRVAKEYVPGSDIVIATDGRLQDSDKLMNDRQLAQELEEFWSEGGRIWAIVLGNLDKEEWYKSLPIVDGIIQLDDITSGDALEKLLGAVADRSPKGSKRTLV